MAIGYGSIAFTVKSESGDLPRPQPFHDRPHVYSASIILADVDDLAALDLLISRVTEKPSLGRRAGKVVADFGTIDDLTIPVDDGGEEVWTARLIELVPTAWMLSGDYVQCDATWLCLERTA